MAFPFDHFLSEFFFFSSYYVKAVLRLKIKMSLYECFLSSTIKAMH